MTDSKDVKRKRVSELLPILDAEVEDSNLRCLAWAKRARLAEGDGDPMAEEATSVQVLSEELVCRHRRADSNILAFDWLGSLQQAQGHGGHSGLALGNGALERMASHERGP